LTVAGGATPTPVRDSAATGTDGGRPPADPADGFSVGSSPVDWRGPVKRSITIAGHETSVSLEPVFWDALSNAAAGAELPLNALVAQIDASRIAVPSPPNLASAIRIWLMARMLRSAH
jgi:predicted DNA-binding ribbon-helix-helix protein